MLLSFYGLCIPSTAPTSNASNFAALSDCCPITIESYSAYPNCYFCPTLLEETIVHDCLSNLGINFSNDEEAEKENRLELRAFIPEIGEDLGGLEGAAGEEGAEGAEGAGAQGEGAQGEGAQGNWHGDQGQDGDQDGEEQDESGEDQCETSMDTPLGPVCVKGGKKNETSQIGEDSSGTFGGVSGQQPSGTGQITINTASVSVPAVSEAERRGVGWVGSGLVWGLFLFAFTGNFL